MQKSRAFAVAALICTAAVTTQAQEYTFSYKGEWDAEKEYKGDYRNTRGDTVQYGEVNGQQMYWWAKFYSKGDVPGEFAPEGGTSPWVLINSKSYSPTGSESYQWRGWNGDFETSLSAGEAALPTWRHGAEGAYTIIQDDIGAIPFETGIKPGWDINKDYPEIRTGWGVFVNRADEVNDWDNMTAMVRDGHEMVCHSYDHTSAAEQWAWGDVGENLPTSVKDPNIPRTLGGLTVVGADLPSTNTNDWEKAYTRISKSTPLGTVEFTANWTGGFPASNIGETVKKGEASITIEPVNVIPSAGVETVSLLGIDYFVKYTKMDTVNGVNEGYVLATKVGWEDYEPGVMDESFKADGGRAVWVFKAKSSDSWADRGAFKREITDATNRIDEMVYNKIKAEDGHFGHWFNPNKKTEYYVYPYDAYSSATHDSIMDHGYVGARGGAKSGKPLPGDFYHPNRIDFDAFYMVDELHTTLFPENPHSIMTLEGMVDSIIAQKGYMIRELHAIVEVGDNWEDVNDNSKGGWWGGITTTLYRNHFNNLQEHIDANRLVVFTPSEAVRYRMTANNATDVAMNKAGDTYEIDVTTTPWVNGDNRWEDEISVVIKLEQGVDQLDVTYKTADPVWGDHPYGLPKKLTADGTAWSINVNPYVGTAVVHPGREWSGDKVSIAETPSRRTMHTKAVAQVQNGTVKLQLPAGNFTMQLFNSRGQLIQQNAVLSAYNSAITPVALEQFAPGVGIIRVIAPDGTALLQQSILIK